MRDGHAPASWTADDVDFGIELICKRLDKTRAKTVPGCSGRFDRLSDPQKQRVSSPIH